MGFINLDPQGRAVGQVRQERRARLSDRRAGVLPARLAFAFCRTHPDDEEDGRTYLDHAGYCVLPGSLPEQVGYRTARTRGRSITETARKDLNERAGALMLELMSRVAAEIGALQQRAKLQKQEVSQTRHQWRYSSPDVSKAWRAASADNDGWDLATPASDARKRSDRTEQLNLRVPPAPRKHLRHVAMCDDIGIALYEEKHGVITRD